MKRFALLKTILGASIALGLFIGMAGCFDDHHDDRDHHGDHPDLHQGDHQGDHQDNHDDHPHDDHQNH